MNELISVIVPIYNVEKYLKKCVDSIIDQTYENLEIILVNDGSTDNSGKIAESYIKIDKRIKVYHKENGGLSDARNFGIKKSKGEYLAFVDSDDFIEKNMYEVLLSNLKEYNADISICGRYIVYPDGKKNNRVGEIKKIKMNKRESLIQLNSYSYFDMSACDKLFKRNLFEDIEFPFGKKCEDYYTMYKIFAKSNLVIYDSIPLYNYYQRANSISRNKKYDDSYIKASKSQVDFFEKNFSELNYIAYTAYFFSNVASFNNIVKNKIKVENKIIRNIKEETRKYYKYVINNKNISTKKRIQAFIFCKMNHLYKVIYLITNR